MYGVSLLVLPITDWSGDRVPRERLDCRVVPVTASARRQLWLLKRSSFTSIDIQNAVSKMRLLCEIVSISLTTSAAKLNKSYAKAEVAPKERLQDGSSYPILTISLSQKSHRTVNVTHTAPPSSLRDPLHDCVHASAIQDCEKPTFVLW